jgi:acyl carrier protein
MSIEQPTFIRNFAAELGGMDPAGLVASTRFRTLERWDSLAVLGVLAMVDAEYGVTIAPQELKTCETIGDIISLVESKQG